VFSQVDGQGSCNDGWMGDGTCDKVNKNYECNYDDGDCCKKELMGDGDCNPENNFFQCHYDYGDCCARQYAGDDICDIDNNFIGCTITDEYLRPVNDYYGTRNNFKQSKTGNTGYQNDGGDCFPRECFLDEDDPLDAALTTKYGKFWYNQVTDDHFEGLPDPQGFFSAIVNQNECRALSCVLKTELNPGFEFEDFFCDTTNGYRSSYQSYYDDFGNGCYCGAEFNSKVPEECCFYDDCTWDVECDPDPNAPQEARVTTLGKVLKQAGQQKKKQKWQGKK